MVWFSSKGTNNYFFFISAQKYNPNEIKMLSEIRQSTTIYEIDAFDIVNKNQSQPILNIRNKNGNKYQKMDFVQPANLRLLV